MGGWGLKFCYEILWGFIICRSYATLTFLKLSTFQCDGVLSFFPLTIFTQQVFEMILFETIQIYPSGYTT